MNSLKVKDNTFWVLMGEEMTLFNNKAEAISILTSLDNPSESKLMTVTCDESDNWTIEQVSWKEIATDLMRSMKGGI